MLSPGTVPTQPLHPPASCIWYLSTPSTGSHYCTVSPLSFCCSTGGPGSRDDGCFLSRDVAFISMIGRSPLWLTGCPVALSRAHNAALAWGEKRRWPARPELSDKMCAVRRGVVAGADDAHSTPIARTKVRWMWRRLSSPLGSRSSPLVPSRGGPGCPPRRPTACLSLPRDLIRAHNGSLPTRLPPPTAFRGQRPAITGLWQFPPCGRQSLSITRLAFAAVGGWGTLGERETRGGSAATTDFLWGRGREIGWPDGPLSVEVGAARPQSIDNVLHRADRAFCFRLTN